jgi:acetyl esterase/lipase
MKFATAFVAVAAFSVPAHAAPPRSFPVAAVPVLEDTFPAQAVVFPGGVKAWRDVVYQQLPGYIPQVVDIYVPASKGPHPLVLYIHGGRWAAGHTRHLAAFKNFPAVMASLAAEGFTVASLEYRLSGEARFPAQLQDAKAALRFLGKHAAQYKLDPKRVGVWGASAGGQLTALTALTCHDTTLDPAAADDVCPTAAVIWYGAFNYAGVTTSPAGKAGGAQLLGCDGTCSDERIRTASPVAYIDAKDPPFLLIHGESDTMVPVDQSREGEAALRKAGVPVEAIYIPDVDHSFIGANPAATRDANLRAVNATFDFFHAKLGAPRK